MKSDLYRVHLKNAAFGSRFVMLYCGLLLVHFTHILLGYFSLPLLTLGQPYDCDINPEEYGEIHCMNLLRTLIITKPNQTKPNHNKLCTYGVGYIVPLLITLQCQITDTSIVCPAFARASNKGNIRTPHHWFFVRGILTKVLSQRSSHKKSQLCGNISMITLIHSQ